MSLPPPRPESELKRRQERGELRVVTAADYRRHVVAAGVEEAFAATDVVVASDATFTDQGSLVLGLGPTDPPIRLREGQLAGVPFHGGHGSSELMLPISGGLNDPQRLGGAQVLSRLLAGESLPLVARGEGTALQPRLDLELSLDLTRLGSARLLLHRAIVENGLVAVSSDEGLIRSPWGPLLGPFGSALYTCGGAGSLGLTSPGLACLGPGSPVLVAGATGWVLGAGSGHQPQPRRLASGHARTPGAAVAVAADLHDLQSRWIRPCWFEGHGSALLVALAAPVPLLNLAQARQAAVDNDHLQAPVLDLSIPRRIKPGFGGVPYSALLQGSIPVDGRRVRAAPAHSPRLAAEISAELVTRLRENRFPLRSPTQPLSPRPGLIPLD
ncbi:MAG: homocysteine biosynthesis protein [Cyanobacteriota bacterium]